MKVKGILDKAFFNRNPITVAKDLLGKVMRVKYKNIWLSARIIETESYFLHDKASHASLGYTEKRKALFMPAGTIYMYHSRAGDSINISCRGQGNAVLIKSGVPFFDDQADKIKMLNAMHQLNPAKKENQMRQEEFLCSGQTLLCKSLGLKIKDWDQKQLDVNQFYFEDCGYYPNKIIQTKRLGIRIGRDEHLMYRFIDFADAAFCTQNPLRRKPTEFLVLNKKKKTINKK